MKRAVAVLLVLAAGACSRTPTPGAGELRVVPLGGEVSLIDGGETSTLDEATTVDAGIGLLTGPDGRAEVQFPGGRSLELAPGAQVQLEEGESEVARGSVLARTDGTGMNVRAGGAQIEASDAVFRVDRDVSVILAVYRGSAAVLGAGVEVPSLSEVTVLPNGSVSEGFKPLQVRPNDEWDIELLGQAIDLGFRLLNLERGLARQLPRNDEVRAVSNVLGEDFPRRAIESAISSLDNAARAVVAAAVAREAARIDGRSVARILDEVVDLQILGAQWVVVVARWGLQQAGAALLKELGDLTVAIARFVAPRPAPSPEGSTSDQQQGGQTNRNTDGGGRPAPPGGGDRNNGGSKPPGPPPPEDDPPTDEPPPPCANPVECAVSDIIDTP